MPVNESNLVADIGRRLAPIITSDLAKFTEPNLITHNNIRWDNASLLGYTSGHQSFMRCRKWKPCRAAIIKKAEELAEKEMILAFDKFSKPMRQQNERGSGIGRINAVTIT
ncbi:hypothetical protein BY996DRAFT_8542925 [Phakopsora pachyrhizi]|nr:hypothetical protein BY996DRAFT_8542925 [Phakopsora pachyrhizi]